MNLRRLISPAILLMAFLNVKQASADDFTDLVAAITKGPSRGSEISEMVEAVTGKRKPSSKASRRRKVSVNMSVLTETMTDHNSYNGILDAMTVETALSTVSGTSGRSSEYGRKNSSIIFPVQNYSYATPGDYRPEFVRPVSGRVTSSFGYRPSFGRMHKGVDLRLNVGDTVRAAMSGSVVHVGYDAGGYGNYIVLRHSDGVETRYGHLQHSLVTEGMYVDSGYPIALGGNTGNSTGPHLHFETRVMGIAMDPMMMFNMSAPVTYRQAVYSSNRFSNSQNENSFRNKGQEIKTTYVVKVGDTLKSIAAKTGISIGRICRLNSLSTTDVPEPGRMLRLH